MRRWFLFLCLRFLVAQDYVCSVTDFSRFVGNVQLKVESYYSRVTISSSQLSDALLYSSAHPEYFPGVYHTKDLTACNQTGYQDQFSLKGPGRLLGVLVLNRTSQGIEFDMDWIESEITFVTPVTNFLPTILSHIPDAVNVYVAGAVSNCSSFYFYPGSDLCGYLPLMDLCEYFNVRYNMFSRQEDMESDYKAGGHWSEPYGNGRGGVTITYSVPVKDHNGTFRGQLAIGVANTGVSALMNQSPPSANGYVFIMTQEGKIVYAQQPVIDILFGKSANLTLSKVVTTWSGFTLLNAAVSVRSAQTPFSQLPDLFNTYDGADDDNNSNSNGSTVVVNSNASLDGYYVSWSRFQETLKTWFLVGLMPTNDIDLAAIWSISPAVVVITLTDLSPTAIFNISVTNNGTLPFNFTVGNTTKSRGLTVNSSSSYRKRRLVANQTKSVDFTIHMDAATADATSFTTNFIVPFYSVPFGYGPCFKPISGEIVVNVVRQPRYVPSSWALTVIYLLCGITGALVIVACVLLFLYRYSAPVLALAPRLCSLQLFGLLMVLGSVVGNASTPTAPICETTKWLLHLGFTMCVAAIAAKNYRNRRIFTSKKLQVVALSDFQLLAFVLSMMLLDAVLLVIGTTVEPSHVYADGQCSLQGWVTYGLLLATKVILWAGAFWNTLRIDNVPSAFADSRLNGVFLVIAIMAIIRLGLQFSNALDGYPQIQIFIGCLFIWFGAFLIWAHIVLKLRSGYVTNARPRSSTKRGSISLSVSRQGLKDRLEALLGEIEAQSTRLLNDKNRAIDNVKANQRLMFEVRAELLAMNTQAHLADDELERFLPTSIKSAFEKYGPAVNRRMETVRAAKTVTKTKEGEKLDELNQLLGAESPISNSPAFSPPSMTQHMPNRDPRNRVLSDEAAFSPLSVTHDLTQRERQESDLTQRERQESTDVLTRRPRADSDVTNHRVHFTPPSRAKQLEDQSAHKKRADEEDMEVEQDPEDQDPSTQDEDTPLAHKEHR